MRFGDLFVVALAAHDRVSVAAEENALAAQL